MAEGGSMEVDEMQEDVPVELPLDVIAAACVHLAARDVVNVMCASRGWYGVASRDELWVHLCATEWGDNWAAPPHRLQQLERCVLGTALPQPVPLTLWLRPVQPEGRLPLWLPVGRWNLFVVNVLLVPRLRHGRAN
jgi:hypothetical protein